MAAVAPVAAASARPTKPFLPDNSPYPYPHGRRVAGTTSGHGRTSRLRALLLRAWGAGLMMRIRISLSMKGSLPSWQH